MPNFNSINDGDLENGNGPIVLDKFRESLRVRSGQNLQTGDQNSVVTEGVLNTVVVEENASIESNNTAVEANGLASIVLNQGTISGGVNGVSATGNRFRLFNRGTIASDSRAVDISDGDGSIVVNSGSILGTDDQRNGTLYVDGTVDNFRLLNQRSGVIDAGEDNLGDAVSVQVGAADDPTSERINIVNNGLFQGRGDGPEVFANGARVGANGSSGLRFFNGSGQPATAVSGSVVNNGTITAEVNVGFLGGLVVEDGVGFNGQIINGRHGLINGPRNGLYIGNADHDLTIRNFGTIQSGSRAVNIDGSGVDLLNNGTIIGTGNQRNGTVYSDATAEDYSIFNGRSGLIDAGEGNQGAGIALQTGEVAGDVVHATLVNQGTIQGRGQAAANLGLAGDGLRIFSGVDGGGTVYRGNIFNQGDILSESTQGATAAVRFANGLAYEGTLTNARGGLIDGAQNGLYFGDAEHDAKVINRGTIQSGSRAVNIDGSGVDLRNFGQILGTGDQRNGTVYADSTAEEYSIFNGRSGLIDAGEGNNGAGVSLQTGDEDGDIVEASLSNDGIIRGRGDGTGNQAGDGVRLFTSVTGSTTFAGDLNNRGQILGTDDGIDIQTGVTLDGDINNTGLIRADQIGVNISGALNGDLNNQGTITGGAASIDASAATAGVTVNNQGAINGDVILSNFDDIFNGAEGTVSGVIDGGGGNDRLIGSRQNENFVGGDGQDTFVFGANSGTDFVLDFSTSTVNGSDVLDFSAVFSDINEILGVGGAATQVGTSTLIDLGNNDSVFLVNVSVNDLTADNFIL
ncbi:calcium-binding protein [Acaryochloris sp. CCMEE 5410]|uniref:beta strand repeat-containing protein n=1 Tax=Acaryochloris sp. CCMEE 5410 TaxID=310037 RepID=UPI00024842EB|nr:calcium-binding protein [Acaryochloris sp. CCMEE 5410]KAI9134902.1 calcium-binding protein [Acaryochloris sp. CCMEE 5410]